jgi:NAD(P)H-flavin reductase
LYKILHKEELCERVKEFIVKAPQVARKARPGQFVIVRINETGERIPLTIADYDAEEETITLIFQEVGKTTLQMGELETGDILQDVVGPLGHPSKIQDYGKVVLVAGGLGIAPLFPIARALKMAGNEVISILGARSAGLIFWEDRIQAYSDKMIVCTDDGSYGRNALVTQPLQEVMKTNQGIGRIWAIGPTIMMKYASEVTRPYKVPIMVSLNTIMIDGIGMCGGCRVTLDGHPQFACVDGPEFDGHLVDWDNLISRLSYYHADEQLSVDLWKRCECNFDEALQHREQVQYG